jgi:hypothetical protein
MVGQADAWCWLSASPRALAAGCHSGENLASGRQKQHQQCHEHAHSHLRLAPVPVTQAHLPNMHHTNEAGSEARQQHRRQPAVLQVVAHALCKS